MNENFYNFVDTKFDFSGPTLYEKLEELQNHIKELEEIIEKNKNGKL